MSATPPFPSPPLLDSASRAFARARTRDPRGDCVHLLMAIAFVGLIGFGTAPLAVMSVIIAVYALLRLWATAGTYGTLITSVLFPLLLVSLGLHSVSLLWSTNIVQGVDELGIFRLQIPLLLVLWPIIDRWYILVWALLAGAAAVGLSQILHRLGVDFIAEMAWDRATPGRYPGFLHPASTSILHATAIALAVGLFVLGRPKSRIVAAAVLALCATGLLLAGSRSLWVAAAAGVAVTAGTVAWSRPRGQPPPARTRGRYGLVAALVVTVGVAGAAIWLVGPLVVDRVEAAIADVRRAVESGDYRSHGGARLRQLQLSWELLQQHPISGVGVGAYALEARRLADAATLERLGRSPESVIGGPPDPTSLRPPEGAGATEPRVGDAPPGAAYPIPVEAPRPGSTAELAGSTLPRNLRDPVLEHPHSALAYSAAVLGVPGLLVYLAIWWWIGRGAMARAAAAARSAGQQRPEETGGVSAREAHLERQPAMDLAGSPGCPIDRPRPSVFDGPALAVALPGAVAALFVAFALDCHNLSAPGTVVLFFVATIAIRPPSLPGGTTPWWAWQRTRSTSVPARAPLGPNPSAGDHAAAGEGARR